MALHKIAVLGPRGSVGRAVIAELLKDGDRFEITAITRPGNTYEPPPPPSTTTTTTTTKVTSTSADFSSLESLTAAFEGQDAVINCISGSASHYEPSKLIIDAALAAPGGVKFFVANEFVGNIHAEQFRRLPEQFVGGKIRIREYLEELGKEGKLKWSAVNGGPFFDMWLMKGPAGFDIKNHRARIYGTGDAVLCWTPLPMMARAVANMIRWYHDGNDGRSAANGDGDDDDYDGSSGDGGKTARGSFINRGVLVNGVRGLSQNAILGVLEDIFSKSPSATNNTTTTTTTISRGDQTSPDEKKVFQVEHIDIAKINKHALIALERGEAGRAMKGLALSNQFYEADQAGDFAALCDNDSLGVEQVSVEHAVRDAIAAYGEDCAIVEGMFYVEPCEI